ncbi:MAG: N-formylglutamate deformylase [Mariniblastus sp.]|nr:N-formylglutamate deformylase [Mariniblastus sp.]
MKLFRFQKGYSPFMISNPHSGVLIPPEIASEMTAAGLSRCDTDWHLSRLYDFPCVESAAMISANLSRYVIDLNRSPKDESLYPGKATTGIVPKITFNADPIYKAGREPDEAEIAKRIEHYWQPYHAQLRAELNRLVEQFGFAVLLDTHSIASEVPMLFEGQLPDFNFGTNHGQSCGAMFQELIEEFTSELDEYSHVINGRFVGGHITRHYGSLPNVHAIQLELNQSTYMDEETLKWEMEKGQELSPVIESFVYKLLKAAESHPSRRG